MVDEPLQGIPWAVLTVWTSKEAFDKWHFINDNLLMHSRMMKEKHVVCIESHTHIVNRVQSVALQIVDKPEDMYTVFKFEIPYDHRHWPRMKCNVSHRDDSLWRESEYTFEEDDDAPDSNTSDAILYVFHPTKDIPISPNLKRFKTESP